MLPRKSISVDGCDESIVWRDFGRLNLVEKGVGARGVKKVERDDVDENGGEVEHDETVCMKEKVLVRRD